MKVSTTIGALFVSSWLVAGAEFTNQFAIYLVAEKVPQESIIDGTASPSGLRLKAQPIISDADWVAYNTTNHTFMVTQATAGRIVEACRGQLQTPFVVVAGGERIYLGVFTTVLSSTSSGVPAIVTDPWSVSTHPVHVRRSIDREYPFPNGTGRGRLEDPRIDHRIVSAVRELFPKNQP